MRAAIFFVVYGSSEIFSGFSNSQNVIDLAGCILSSFLEYEQWRRRPLFLQVGVLEVEMTLITYTFGIL